MPESNKAKRHRLFLDRIGCPDAHVSKLRDRARDFAEPVRVIDGTLRINEAGMIPEVPYDVVWNDEQYQVFKTLDSKVRIFEVMRE